MKGTTKPPQNSHMFRLFYLRKLKLHFPMIFDLKKQALADITLMYVLVIEEKGKWH